MTLLPKARKFGFSPFVQAVLLFLPPAKGQLPDPLGGIVSFFLSKGGGKMEPPFFLGAFCSFGCQEAFVQTDLYSQGRRNGDKH